MHKMSSSQRLICLLSLHGLSTDHSWLGIDTLSTYCMTNDVNDFNGTPTKIHKEVTGIMGDSTQGAVSLQGTGTFHIMDDAGQICALPIHDLHYCATAPYRILSPQRIDKEWRLRNLGTMQSTTDSVAGTILKWTDSQDITHRKTIPHTSKSGLPLCYTAPNYQGYQNNNTGVRNVAIGGTRRTTNEK